jgi:hypothetical protein
MRTMQGHGLTCPLRKVVSHKKIPNKPVAGSGFLKTKTKTTSDLDDKLARKTNILDVIVFLLCIQRKYYFFKTT